MARPWTFADLPVPPTAWADLKDASTVTVDGSYAISAVRSKGTLGGNFVPPSAARAPTYATAAPGNYPVAAYDPSRETTLILDAYLGNQPRTVVVAWISGGSRQSYEIVVDFSTSQGDRPIIFGSREDNRVYLYAGDNVPVPGSTAAGVMHVLIVEFADASSRYYYNGAEVAGVNPGYFVPQAGLVMGGLSPGVLFSGQFAELAVIPGLHSGDEWDRITQGTMWKWGQQAKIAPGATYRNAAPTVSSGPTLSADGGSMAVAGRPAQLRHGYALPAPTGSLALTGVPVATRAARRLPAFGSAIVATGTTVSTRAARRLQTGIAALALTEGAAALIRSRRLFASSGGIDLTGSAVQPRSGRSLAAAAGAVMLRGRALNLLHGATLAASSGQLAASGQQVAFRTTRRLAAGAGATFVTGYAVGFSRVGVRSLAVGAGGFQLATASAVLARSIRMPASAGAAELSGKPATLRLARRFVAAPIALGLTGLAAIIRVSGVVQLRPILSRIARAPRRPTIIRAGNKRTMIWPTKRVHEILDHGIDWTDRLGAGETIVSSDSAPEGGLTVSQQAFDGPVSMLRLAGGTPGITRVLCSVTTSRGQLLEEAVRITVAA